MKEPKCEICGGKHNTAFCWQNRKPIKRKSKNKPAYGFKNQVELFNYVWDNTEPRKCFVSGEDLNKYYGTDRWYSCFMHILPKGRFTHWRLNPENIRLGSPEVHHLFDQGTEEQRANSGYDFRGLYELYDKLNKEYSELYS